MLSTQLRLILAGFCLIGCLSQAAEIADVIYAGGHFVTMNEAAPSAEALAVKGDRILSVGPTAEVLKTKGKSTKVVDLAAKRTTTG